MMKEIAKRIFLQTLAEMDVLKATQSRVSRQGRQLGINGNRFDLERLGSILLIAFGKCAVPMARGFLDAVGPFPLRGVVATNYRPDEIPLAALHDAGLEFFEGGHPVPNNESLAAAERILRLTSSAGHDDLAVFLLSGGGSAIVEKPITDLVTLDDLQSLNRLLVTSGAPIAEMNIVRKHLSTIKGGRLARSTSCRHQVSLYISDTNASDLPAIASGPTLPDRSTWRDVREIIARYRLEGQLPGSVRTALADPLLPDTPKPEELNWDPARHILILSNADAVSAALRVARNLGVSAVTLDLPVEGDYRDAAEAHVEALSRLLETGPDHQVCLISGGEVSCKVHGEGIGGRNQEFVLYAAMLAQDVDGLHDCSILSAGTDGIDGNSPAAGAVADSTTFDRARAMKLNPADFLERNDSFSFFDHLGDAIITGPTGNNVRDLRLFLASRSSTR